VSDLVLIKIGGSLITDKRRPGSLRRGILDRISREVAAAARTRQILLGHGSGSFGHAAAVRHGLTRGPVPPSRVRGVAATQDRAARLHRKVIAALESAGAMPFSLAPSSFVTAREGRPVSLRAEPIELALEMGLLPVVFGDVVLDRSWGASICSTETVFLAVARRLLRSGRRIRRAVWLGATDGVYDGAGRTIPRIEPGGLRRIRGQLLDAEGIDITGGIRHRLRTAVTLARLGIPSTIIDGRTPGMLQRALSGRAVGTRVVPVARESVHG
jgi:isopentenyl phosphate kinase